MRGQEAISSGAEDPRPSGYWNSRPLKVCTTSGSPQLATGEGICAPETVTAFNNNKPTLYNKCYAPVTPVKNPTILETNTKNG